MPSGSIPATGKTVQVPLADVIQVRDGKIQAVSCYFAATVLMSQLGQMPVRKAA
jgi:ketosteroid isomerase-like protein